MSRASNNHDRSREGANLDAQNCWVWKAGQKTLDARRAFITSSVAIIVAMAVQISSGTAQRGSPSHGDTGYDVELLAEGS
jgi:hypothetical protein